MPCFFCSHVSLSSGISAGSPEMTTQASFFTLLSLSLNGRSFLPSRWLCFDPSHLITHWMHSRLLFYWSLDSNSPKLSLPESLIKKILKARWHLNFRLCPPSSERKESFSLTG
jgi:hypothetical protein